MSARTCSAPGCERTDMQSRAYCRMHYHRVRRTGSVDGIRVHRPARGVCTELDCTALDCGPHGLCPKHVTRVRRHGSPDVVLAPWSDKAPNYFSIHQRIRRERGPASAHLCVDCGSPATSWAYNNRSAEEQLSEEGLRYSENLSDYDPRCGSCHWRFDAEARAAS